MKKNLISNGQHRGIGSCPPRDPLSLLTPAPAGSAAGTPPHPDACPDPHADPDSGVRDDQASTSASAARAAAPFHATINLLVVTFWLVGHGSHVSGLGCPFMMPIARFTCFAS